MTSIVNRFVAIGLAVVAAVETAFKSVEGAVMTEADKALVYIRQNEPLVTKLLNTIEDIGGDITKVPGDLVDDYETFINEGGFAHLLDEGKTLLKTFVSSIETDLANDLRSII